MIARLKSSRAGKLLFRASQHVVFGAPLRVIARLVQAEALHPSHLLPANRRHNAKQTAILTVAENEGRQA